MAKYYNLARMTTATTGTGTITLGSAVSGFLTFAQAGVSNSDVVAYAISDGANSEIGTGTYTSSGTTLTRTVVKSTNSDSAINLSGTAEVFITALAADVLPAASTTEIATGSATDVAITPGRAQRHPSAAKAYLHINAAQTTINKSFNVTSVTDSATGDCAVNFTTAFDSSTYAIAAMPQEIIAAGTNPVLICQAECTSASASRLVSSYGGNGVTVTFYDTPKGAAYYGILS